jgi:hypothetical protein
MGDLDNLDNVWESDELKKVQESILDGSYKYCSKTQCPYLSKLISGKGADSNFMLKENFNIKNTKSGPKNINFAFDRSCNLSCPSCRNTAIMANGEEVEFIDKKRDAQGQVVEDNLLSDTRTFLYIEVLQSAEKYDSWILGRSPSRGNYSDSFGEFDLNNRNERYSNEVGVLNYFTWLGIVGVILLLSVYVQATKFAVLCSENIYAKILGIFISFRWAFSWIEEINIFHIQYVYLWFMIGLCFSEKFRKMSDNEVRVWIYNIF